MHARLTDIRDGSKKITIDRDKKKCIEYVVLLALQKIAISCINSHSVSYRI